MKLLCVKLAKFALLRAIVFAAMGIITLLSYGFLQGTVFYVIVGYVFLNGIWIIADYFLYGNETKSLFRYGSLVTAVLMIAFAILSITYGSYLVHIASLYLGGLMLVNGLVYIVVALCTKTRGQWLLAFLSMFVLTGSGAIVIFTFGFEIVMTLSQVSSITLLLSCTYEFVAYLIYRKSNYGHMEREEIK